MKKKKVSETTKMKTEKQNDKINTMTEDEINYSVEILPLPQMCSFKLF
jgi:hypothetical protein